MFEGKFNLLLVSGGLEVIGRSIVGYGGNWRGNLFIGKFMIGYW